MDKPHIKNSFIGIKLLLISFSRCWYSVIVITVIVTALLLVSFILLDAINLLLRIFYSGTGSGLTFGQLIWNLFFLITFLFLLMDLFLLLSQKNQILIINLSLDYCSKFWEVSLWDIKRIQISRHQCRQLLSIDSFDLFLYLQQLLLSFFIKFLTS